MGIEGGNTSSKSGNVDKFLSPPPGFEGCSKSVNVDKLLSPPPGFEGVNRSSKSGNVDKLLSPPPGFESQARFVLRKVQEKTNGFRPGDADSFKKLLNRRPWIVQEHTTPSSGVLKTTKPEVPLLCLTSFLSFNLLCLFVVKGMWICFIIISRFFCLPNTFFEV